MLVELLVEILDAVVVCGDGDSFYSLLYEVGGDLGLVFANIIFAKEKLPIQIGNIDSIWDAFSQSISLSGVAKAKWRTHIYDMNVLESRHGEVLENLAS